MRKVVYQYDYVDQPSKLEVPSLPQESFYSLLREEGITDDDYNHAKQV